MNPQTDCLPHRVNIETRDDESLILSCGYPIDPVVKNTGEWLHHWAKETPNAVFLAERSGDSWRELTYQQTLDHTRSLAAYMLQQGLKPGDRVAVLSGNSVDHGLVALATQYVGLVCVPVAEQYSMIPEARDRLSYVIEKTRPELVFVSDAKTYREAITLPALAEIPVLASIAEAPLRPVTLMSDALKTTPDAATEAAHTMVGPDTLAKILFTSGSTSQPKGVCTTHRMMCVNQAQMSAVMPFLKTRRPKILDWLPWNHVFGGSHNFNMMLANGGSLYIDGGKPVEPLFDQTLQNLEDHSGSLAFNVPVGWSLLASALEADADLRRKFFADLDLIFYAGASLPQDVWTALQDQAMRELGHVPLMTSSWGMTETAPAVLMVHEPIDQSGVIGVPVPECLIKLIPESPGRYELRVKGPNIMETYFEDLKKTAEAFDDEGYLKTEDAVRFVNPDNPNAGLLFDGRISEDFKLMTGTWVQSANVRAKTLAVLTGLAQDVVITGHGRREIGVLVFPYPNLLQAEGYDDISHEGALAGGKLAERIKKRLAEGTLSATGSSTTVRRALIVANPPSVKAHEVTAKGSLNIQKVLAERAEMVERLYDDNDPAIIKV